MNSIINTSIICFTAMVVAFMYFTFQVHEGDSQRMFTEQMLMGKKLSLKEPAFKL